jgi:hypothetical protein
VAWCDEHAPELLGAFAGSDAHWRRAPLPERFAAFIAQRDMPVEVMDLVRLEHAIARADERMDDDIEVLAFEPDAVDLDVPGTLRWSRAFDWLQLDARALALHAGDDHVLQPPPARCLVGAWRGGVSVVPIWSAVVAALEELRHGPMDADDFEELLARTLRAAAPLPPDLERDAREWIHELLDAGAIGYVPRLTPRA